MGGGGVGRSPLSRLCYLGGTVGERGPPGGLQPGTLTPGPSFLRRSVAQPLARREAPLGKRQLGTKVLLIGFPLPLLGTPPRLPTRGVTRGKAPTAPTPDVWSTVQACRPVRQQWTAPPFGMLRGGCPCLPSPWDPGGSARPQRHCTTSLPQPRASPALHGQTQYRAHGGCTAREDGVGWRCGPAGVEAEGNAVARPTCFLSRPLSPSVTLFDRLGTADGPKGPGLPESEVPWLPVPAQPRRWRGVGRELASEPKSWSQPVLGTLGSSCPSLGHTSWRLVLEASTHFRADSPPGCWLPRISHLQVVIEASFDCPPPPKRQAA